MPGTSARRTTPRTGLAMLLASSVLAAGACTSARPRSTTGPAPSVSAERLPATTAASTTAASTTTTTSAPAPLSWAPCGDGFECARAHPPVDYARAGGATADLAVVRLRASGPPSVHLGTLFVNPGGPGASAVAFARGARRILAPTLLAHFDIVGFDPRGVGDSQGISCEDGPGLDRYFALDLTPDTPAEHQALVDGNRTLAQECARRNGPLLAHVDTPTAARDLDFVRASMGEDKVSYLGFSYGTYLGAVYADLFPSRVRAFVLDGAIDPALSASETNRQQAAGFERSLSAFLAQCAAQPACPFHSGGDPKGALARLTARVDAASLPAGSRSLTAGELPIALADSLYRPSDWPGLASALQQGAGEAKGDLLLQLSDGLTQRHQDGSYGTLLSANAAVNCVDRPWPTRVEDYDADARRFAAESPTFGPMEAYGGLMCAFWAAPPVDRPRPRRAAGSPPIVVVGTTEDPATPFPWAQALATQLESGVLVTHVGQGHTSLAGNSSCVRLALEAYLIRLTAPRKGLTCADD